MKILQTNERGRGAYASMQIKWKMTQTVRKRPDLLYRIVEGGPSFQGKFLFFSPTQLIRLKVADALTIDSERKETTHFRNIASLPPPPQKRRILAWEKSIKTQLSSANVVCLDFIYWNIYFE